MRTRRGKYSRIRRNFAAKVKKVIMKTAETKYYDIGLENAQLYHNLGYGDLLPPTTITSVPELFDPWSKILKGTNRMNRIGDRITPRGMSLKFWIANKFTRPNTMVRLIVAILPKVVDDIVTNYDNFNPFQITNEGLTNNHLLLPADKDRGVKFLYDRIFRINTTNSANVIGDSQKEPSRIVKLWIRRKRSRDIVYSTGTQQIVNKPLAVFLLPYEQYSTLQTSNTTSFSCAMRMYYKDV